MPNTFSRKPTGNADASGDQLNIVPPISGNGIIQLSDLVGNTEIASIQAQGFLQFHAVGDTGVGTGEQEMVANAMAKEQKPSAIASGPAFWVHLGDILYGPNKNIHYRDKFYRINDNYLMPAPGVEGIILGIPGNHDGEVRNKVDAPSLSAFLENFCSKSPTEANFIGATMPNQPGPYWYLNAPFVDIVGLYSNTGENNGTLSGVNSETFQTDWLGKTLTTIAAARANTRKALVFVVHHPPYARGLDDSDRFGGHASSPVLQQQLDTACAAEGIWPDMIIAGHAHNYQFYRRTLTFTAGGTKEIAYLVAGTGGISAQPVPNGQSRSIDETNLPGGATGQVVYADATKAYGYLRMQVTTQSITATFVEVDGTMTTEYATIEVALANQQIIRP